MPAGPEEHTECKEQQVAPAVGQRRWRCRVRPQRRRQSAMVQGSGVRTSRTSSWSSSSARKPRVDQCCRCPGVLPSAAPIAAARHVEHAPQRLARHADDQVRLGQTREHAKRPRRIGEMLQHLAAHHQLGAIGVGRQRVADRRRGSVTGRPRSAARRRAIATADGLRSLPRTAKPRSASMVLRKPSPQPTSCTSPRAAAPRELAQAWRESRRPAGAPADCAWYTWGNDCRRRAPDRRAAEWSSRRIPGAAPPHATSASAAGARSGRADALACP